MGLQPEVDYLKGVAENDLAVLQLIYRESLPEVIKFVRKNSGTADDAKDVFQEAILIIFRKLSNEELELTTRFHLYLFSICKRIWLKKLRNNRNREVPFAAEKEYGFEEHLEEQFLKSRGRVPFPHISQCCFQRLADLNGNPLLFVLNQRQAFLIKRIHLAQRSGKAGIRLSQPVIEFAQECLVFRRLRTRERLFFEHISGLLVIVQAIQVFFGRKKQVPDPAIIAAGDRVVFSIPADGEVHAQIGILHGLFKPLEFLESQAEMVVSLGILVLILCFGARSGGRDTGEFGLGHPEEM